MTELSTAEWDLRIEEIAEISKKNAAESDEMKWYIFVDFDGVVNLWDKPIDDMSLSIKESETQFLDYDCVRRLSDFCKECGGSLIISSSWRFKGLEYCRDYLYRGGLDPSVPIVGTTELDYDNREIHITDYLLEHPDFIAYIVIDDVHLPHLASHEIMCETQTGFTEEKLGEARLMVQKVVGLYQDYLRQLQRDKMFAEMMHHVEFVKE